MKPENKSTWQELVNESRSEEPPTIDVRRNLMSELQASTTQNTQEDWITAIVELFNPRVVKFGFVLFLACLILLSTLTQTSDTNIDLSEDPLINFLDGSTTSENLL